MTATTTPGELGERSQRWLAVAFAAMLAAGATVLLMFAPKLIKADLGSVPYYQSPALLPVISLSIVAIFASIHMVKLLRGASMTSDDIDEPTANWRVVLASFGCYAGYVVVVPLIGYVAGTILFIIVTGLVSRLGWRWPLLAAVVLTAVLFAVFVIGLQVWFPEPAIFSAH